MSGSVAEAICDHERRRYHERGAGPHFAWDVSAVLCWVFERDSSSVLFNQGGEGVWWIRADNIESTVENEYASHEREQGKPNLLKVTESP